MPMNIGKVLQAELIQEMQTSYINYAMSVIVSRALPDVRDGLKPVHRRILYSMQQMGLLPPASYSKSAKVVGETMGKFHPHGDQAIYDALVRLAQPFSMRYPIVDGQGNFGCFTKDTKVKLADGRELTFGELIKEDKKGKKNYTYTVNKLGLISIAQIKNPRLTIKSAEIIKVTLDNGQEVKCTPNHLFMLKDGTYKEAQSLSPKDSLMPLYHKLSKEVDRINREGYVLVFQPKTNDWIPVHHLAGRMRHHVNFNKLDNNPDLVRLEISGNHKVVKIEQLAYKEDVYDLTIDNTHNFALASGVFVHNSVDGDSAAAMRYTEVRLGKIAEELLRDIEKDTVDFQDNFDASIKEPVYLPATIPNLLLMGSEGIAVGMATKIPPHNLGEVVDAILATIKKGEVVKQEKNPEFSIKKIDLAVAQGKKTEELNLKAPETDFDSNITTEELMQYVKGPDFPTGGAIYGGKFLPEMYGSGRGKVVIRGIAKIEEAEDPERSRRTEKGKSRISITELPYQVNKALLVARIAELVRDKKLIGISDIRDESDKRGMTVVIELKKDARPKSVLNNLYKQTSLQTSFPANFVALVDGTPRTLTLKQILIEYIKHRQKVITRRSIYDLTELKRRAHILEGYKIALDHLDEVIKTIRASKDTETAKINLMEKFGFTQIQAVAILDMQLRRLSALEREKIEEEYKKIGEQIAYLTDLLEHPVKILGVIEEELKVVKEKYGDERRTKVYANPVGEISEEDLIAKEEVIVTVTKTGYIKRVPRATYKAQARGGKGVMGMTTKEEDEIAHLISSSTHDQLMFFTNKGRVFGLKTWEIGESSRQAKGQAVVNLINIDQGEEIQAILTQDDPNAKFFMMATQHGTIKKTAVNQFQNIRSSGLTAIKLDKGDRLTWVRPSSGEDNLLMVSRKGKSIRFSEKDVRPMGRPTTGVRGILLGAGDEVIGMEVLPSREPVITDKRRKTFKDILVIMEKGIGKRTPISGFPIQKRGGQGVKVAEITDKTGEVAAALLVTEEVEQVLITSRSAQVIRLPIKNIPQLGRATQGVILMRFGKDKTDRVAAVATLDKEETEDSVTPQEDLAN